MFKHQLLMAFDEARVDSCQCFLKSFPIMPFLLETCVDTYAYGYKHLAGILPSGLA
jgi:hypothetical protein